MPPRSGVIEGPWPLEYQRDWTLSVNGTGIDNGSVQKGMPTAYIRGGYRLLNEQAGAFNLDVTYGPSYFYQILGARCCLGSR